MSKTMELVLLDEGGQFVASLHPTVTSAPEYVKFENRHYRRTGKLRDSPEEWQYDRAHTVSGRKDCVVFIGDGCPVWRTGDPPMSKAETKTCSGVKGGLCATCNGSGIVTTGVADNRDAWGRKYGEPQPATANATGHDGCIRGLEKANATIAEQAAEIERLKQELFHATTPDAALTVERDTLRLEVQKLKDLSFEAQDRYAALEVERDALKAKLKDAETVATLAADRKRLLGEANARAEKYAAVIEAMHAERDALSAYYLCHHNALAAQAAAGYLIGEAPTWQAVKDLVKEADHD